ncbi:MAG: S41 family peptidase [Pseudomonadota bacterium]
MREIRLGLMLMTLLPTLALSTPLDRALVQADLALARETLQRVHPGYDRYTSTPALDRMWRQLDQSFDEQVTLTEAYLGLSRILAAIRCDHTKAELPKAMVQARESSPLYLPFRFRLFSQDGGHRMYVSQPGGTPLARGDEILTIDGTPVQDRLADVAPYIPVDGFTDHVKSVVLASSSEFLGSGFDHFDPLLNDVAAQVVVKARSSDGVIRERTLPRIGYAAFRDLTSGKRWGQNFSDPGVARIEFPTEKVAVLSVDTFVNYRKPVKPEAIYGPLFRQAAERGVETMILDLRSNGGGSTDAQLGLVARLIDKPTFGARDVRVKTINLDGLRDHLDTWEKAALNPQPGQFNRRDDGWWSVKPEFGGVGEPLEPQADAFGGRLIVLTSRSNSSGSTSFVSVMQATGRATLVGESTGGSQEGPTAGIIFFLTLPNTGIVVRVPYQLTEQVTENPVYGRGFDPDIEAPETYESWLAGRDPALEAAIKLANSGMLAL